MFERLTAPTAALCIAFNFMAASLQAETSDKLEAFLTVTGFDVALESIRLSADSAPMMIGLDASAFGATWATTVDEVFDVEEMHEQAVEILQETLAPELLDHAVTFYTSDLGQRLVTAENASHMRDDGELKKEMGDAIIAGLVRLGAPRLELLKRLNAATGSIDASIHAIQEIQVRVLMAAAAAGVIELRMDEPDLRANLEQQEGELRRTIQTNGLSGSAYTYQAFSDDEVYAYAEALEDPMMQEVYALMNAVQFQIMADRFEAVTLRLRDIQPTQEL
ncbi:MAG: DUF2059 domain-containing protein [Roseobacter sp.]